MICRPLPAGVRSRFIELFRNPEMIGWDNGYESGRFDSRRAARVATGNGAVFKRRWELDEVRSAVSIVIDLSSSMSKAIDDKARATAAFEIGYAMSECLDAAGVENDVLGFRCTRDAVLARTGDSLTGSGGANEWVNTTYAKLLRFKRTDQRAVMRRPAFAGAMMHVGGGTPDYQGVRGALEMLARNRAAKQKFCLALTDGEGNAGPEGFRRLTKYANANGILLIGIGIAYDVSSVYPVHVRVDSVEGLNEQVVATIRTAAERVSKQRLLAMR